MKLKRAIDRLRFTISKQNKPNEKDVEAFNEVLSFFELSQKDTLQDNQHFAKLYTYILGKLTAHYKDVSEANKHLNKILSQPQESLTQTLLMELKAMEVRSVFKDEFLKDKKPTDVEKTLKNYPEFQQDFVQAWEHWDIDNVVAHLNTNINLSLKCLKK